MFLALTPLSNDQLILGLSDGLVGILNISHAQTTTEANGTTPPPIIGNVLSRRIREPDGVPIQQIAIDHIQEMLYILRTKVGLIRCSIETCENNSSTSLVMGSSSNVIQSIAVDSQNG
jgi:hypothetical protein